MLFLCLVPGKWRGVFQVRERGHAGPRHLRHPGVVRGAEQVGGQEGGLHLLRLPDHGAQRPDALQPRQTPAAAAQGPTHAPHSQGEHPQALLVLMTDKRNNEAQNVKEGNVPPLVFPLINRDTQV